MGQILRKKPPLRAAGACCAPERAHPEVVVHVAGRLVCTQRASRRHLTHWPALGQSRSKRRRATVYFCPAGGTLPIQPMPKRSVTMPKRGDQNVFVSGMRTCPPSCSAAKARSASLSFGTDSEREKPWKL